VSLIPDKILEKKGTVYYHVRILKKQAMIETKKGEISGNMEAQVIPEKRELFSQIIETIKKEQF
jgi:hypothetical protein